LGPANRAEFQALLTDRNTPRKVVWRAGIVLVTADGCGTNEVMQRSNMSKPTVWRWQARYLDEGIDGLRLADRHGITHHRVSVWRFLRGLGLTHRNRPARRAVDAPLVQAVAHRGAIGSNPMGSGERAEAA